VDVDLIEPDVLTAIDEQVLDAPPDRSSEEIAQNLSTWARETYRAGPGQRDILHLLDRQLEEMSLRELELVAPEQVTDRLMAPVREKVGEDASELDRETLLHLMDDLVNGAVDRYVYTEATFDLRTRAENMAAWVKEVFGFEPELRRLVGLRDRDLDDVPVEEVLVRPQAEVQAAVRAVLRDAFEHNRLTFTLQRYQDLIRRAIWLQVETVLFAETLPPAAPSRARRLTEWMYQTFTVELEPQKILSFIKDEMMPTDPRRDDLEDFLFNACEEAYEKIEEEQGAEAMRTQERFVMLEIIDRKWKDHLRDMDHLKEGIWLESYGGKDPKERYKKEGWRIFVAMLQRMYDEIAELIFKVRIAPTERYAQNMQSRWNISSTGRGDVGGFGEQNERDREAAERAGKDDKVETIRRERPKVGPNEPCWCGSGKKYKKCHMKQDRRKQRGAAAAD
jgi:hypothetical protein